MVFQCQKDSTLKEFTATVVSCCPSQLKTVKNGKTETIEGFDIICDDTILFPEGGGQPCDFGFLNDVAVLQVIRRNTEAVHFVQNPLSVGEKVKQLVNWDRRFDHMQQHSGQHLITAYANKLFGYATTAWWLGEDITHIELDTNEMSVDQIKQLEEVVNLKIREGLPVKVNEYENGDPILSEFRTRGLPDGMEGNVRVVSIEGVENDLCCGTHVNNLCQLQMIKLLDVEKGKKGKINLQFLVGGRALKRLTSLLEKEQKITSILNNGPEVHIELVEKLHKNSKVLLKNHQNALKEIAAYEAKKVKEANPRPKFYDLHRKDAEPDFIQTFIREIGDNKTLLLLTVGDEKGAGHMVLYGEEQYIADFGNEVCSLLEGKGNGKGTKFQARVSNLKKLKDARKLILDKLSKETKENNI